MDELWTPWRMQYIVGSKETSGCIFCPDADGERVDDLLLHRGRSVFTVLNLYPYVTGHLMIVPYRHVPRFAALSADEREELGAALQRAEAILRRASGARWFHAGINLGRAAGAGVDGHLHVHLVPGGTTGDWADAPGSESPALPVDEVRRRLLPHFQPAMTELSSR